MCTILTKATKITEDIMKLPNDPNVYSIMMRTVLWIVSFMEQLDMESHLFLQQLHAFFFELESVDKISEIYACETTDDIIMFCRSSELLYFIMDQTNALDLDDNTVIAERLKSHIIEALNQMTLDHYVIRSSSANNKTALHLKRKQTNEKMITLYGGFDEDEMTQWWKKNESNLPSMNDEQKKRIEYITGNNPFFLSFLLVPKEVSQGFENAWDNLNQLLILKMQEPMTKFSESIAKESKERWELIHWVFKSSSFCALPDRRMKFREGKYEIQIKYEIQRYKKMDAFNLLSVFEESLRLGYTR
ncbi:8615_t:CDS:2 [Funneliformis mosseae]|uniref:8615_t:CDS:1 n=1 Tax=Funneliformis mosseae TaxID=27381 RepID=A0A9N9GQ91_FUNMO|nr:8615_t:CDS:2 [Funneliformis mosseae]